MSNNFLMDNRCFACGSENPRGLRLNIIETEDGVLSEIRLPKDYQGYSDIAHGGIIATILDEMAVWAAYKKGYKSATVEMKVRIKKPVKIEQEYLAFGRVVNVRHGIVEAEAEIKEKLNGSSPVASAIVKLIRIE